jgi:tetratricopeptide (TPR) repeat protein
MKRTFYLLLLLFTGFVSACNSNDPNGNRAEVPGEDPGLQALNQQIAEQPANDELYFQRANYYYQQEAYDEALVDLDRALALDSTMVDYHHLLADVYLDYYKSYEALKTLEKAADQFPSSIRTLLKLSEFQLILKQHEASMRTVDRILKQDPQNAEAYFMFGLNFEELGDTLRAINSYQQAVELDPDILDAWISLGQLHAGLGNDIAARFFDNAIRVAPQEPQVYFAKAAYLSDQNRLQEALEVYDELIRISPQFTAAYFNSGLLYLDLDSLDRARQMFDMAVKVDPAYVKAYYYRAVSREMMGDLAGAKTDYEQALRLVPDLKAAEEALARLARAQQTQ